MNLNKLQFQELCLYFCHQIGYDHAVVMDKGTVRVVWSERSPWTRENPEGIVTRESKVVFQSEYTSMVNAAFWAFTEWMEEAFREEESAIHHQQACEIAAENAATRYYENQGSYAMEWQDQRESKYAPLDPQSGLYGHW